MVTKDRTFEEVVNLVADTDFRPFSKSDWMTWSGCESENPRLGEITDGDVTTLIILDGNVIWVQDFPSDPVSTEDTDEGRFYRITR